MINDDIRKILNSSKYDDSVADIIIRLLDYMNKKKWIGACYATASVLYVCLSEIGCKPKLCIGEATTDYPKIMSFDHGWIELNGKIMDLACSMTLLGGIPVGSPVILGKDIVTGEETHIRYGFQGKGLDYPAKWIVTVPLGEYMNKYPEHKDGLWGVAQEILNKKGSIKRLKDKYSENKWNYIVEES